MGTHDGLDKAFDGLKARLPRLKLTDRDYLILFVR